MSTAYGELYRLPLYPFGDREGAPCYNYPLVILIRPLFETALTATVSYSLSPSILHLYDKQAVNRQHHETIKCRPNRPFPKPTTPPLINDLQQWT